jgi:cyclic beta-1,2-glucan synthetase
MASYMKEIPRVRVRGKRILRTLVDLRSRVGRTGLAQEYAGDEPPLRSELFSSDQMKRHGKALADSHKLSLGRASDRLLTRLAENEGVLIGACNLLTAAVKANRRIAPAGEWLLDNFYLIEEQIRMARRHLPKGYSRELPRLLNGSSAGLPRVYDIALEIISHGDGRVDPENLSSFVTAYQTVTVLKLANCGPSRSCCAWP